MVATLASQFFIVWMIDKFGWFKTTIPQELLLHKILLLWVKVLHLQWKCIW